MMYIREQSFTDKQDKNQLWRNILLCGLLFILIACRGVNSIFIYFIAAISSLIFITTTEEECFLYLVFLAPFSLVLKTSVGGMTFYNLFILLVLLRVFFSVGFVEKEFLIPLLFFLAYCFVFSGISHISTTITIGAWLLLVYSLNKFKVNSDWVVWAYSAGLCLSSLLGLVREKLPLINTFLTVEQMKLAEKTYAERFSGLQPNPNYLSLDLSVAMSCIVALVLIRKAKLVDWILLFTLFVFGLMTISQSFIVGIVPLLLLWIFFSSKYNISKSVIILFAISFFGLIIYIFGQKYIDLFMFRIGQRQGESLSKVTTGRSDIWVEYLRAIISSPKTLLVGNGFNSLVESGSGAHNTYLDLVFSLGLCGCSIYFVLIFMSLKKIFCINALKIPIIVLLIRLFAITITTWDNIWIYFILFVCIANSEIQFNRNNIDTKKATSRYLK